MPELSDNDIIKQANLIEYRNKHLRQALDSLKMAERADKEVAVFQDDKEQYAEASERLFKAIREQVKTWL